jgi:hypothetical protein
MTDGFDRFVAEMNSFRFSKEKKTKSGICPTLHENFSLPGDIDNKR